MTLAQVQLSSRTGNGCDVTSWPRTSFQKPLTHISPSHALVLWLFISALLPLGHLWLIHAVACCVYSGRLQSHLQKGFLCRTRTTVKITTKTKHLFTAIFSGFSMWAWYVLRRIKRRSYQAECWTGLRASITNWCTITSTAVYCCCYLLHVALKAECEWRVFSGWVLAVFRIT